MENDHDLLMEDDEDNEDQLAYYDLVLDNLLSISEFGDAKYYASLRDVSRRREELRKKKAVDANNARKREKRNGSHDDEEKMYQTNKRKAEEFREKLNSGQYRNETIEAVCRSFRKDVPKKSFEVPEKSQIIPPDNFKKDVPKLGSAVESEKLVEAPKESQQVIPPNEKKKESTKKKTSQPHRKQRNALLNALNEKKLLNDAEPSTSTKVQFTVRAPRKCSAASTENEPSSSHNAMTSITPLVQTSPESLDVTEQFQFLLLDNADSAESADEEDDFSEYGRDDNSVLSSNTSNYTTVSNTSNYTTASSSQERFIKKEKKIEKKTSQRRRFYKPCQNLLTDPPSKKPWTYSPKKLAGEQLPEYTKSNFPPLS